ncbi:MAG: hypothetical protein QM741_04305 [Rudaea sp.]|uniref:hypothetical protein n=1 Tax=Rudaea sp. TaxID=2136325 RepID=UPI0039E23A92
MKFLAISAVAITILCPAKAFPQMKSPEFAEPGDKFVCEKEYMDTKEPRMKSEVFMDACARRKNIERTGSVDGKKVEPAHPASEKPDQEKAIARAQEVMQSILRTPIPRTGTAAR